MEESRENIKLDRRLIKNLDEAKKISINDFKALLKNDISDYSEEDISLIQNFAKKDNRTGIKAVYNSFLKRKKAYHEELNRVVRLYDFQDTISGRKDSVILGLDEVGRGPLAGPLTVGGVILKSNPKILGLNDSKQINPKNRIKIADKIKENCIA